MENKLPHNKIIYQNQADSDLLGNSIRWYNGVGFPFGHLHASAELIVVDTGEVQLNVNGKTEVLLPGQCALILPHRLHSFTCSPDAFYWVHVFSAGNAPSFFGALGSRNADRAAFACSTAALDYYRSRCLITNPDFTPEHHRNTSSYSAAHGNLTPLAVKSALYAVLTDYLSVTELSTRTGSSDTLFGQIMLYITEHCREDITLASVAGAVGYETHYLCRYMKKITDIPFRTIVNRCRIDIACQLLETTDLPVTEIALRSGYSSMCTFNRVFRMMEGVSPRLYRQNLLSANAGAASGAPAADSGK